MVQKARMRKNESSGDWLSIASLMCFMFNGVGWPITMRPVQTIGHRMEPQIVWIAEGEKECEK